MTLNVRALLCLDVDGTLARVSTGQHVAARLGHLDELVQAEAGYAAGALDNRAVAELDAAAYRGRTPAEVVGWLDDLSVVRGIGETVEWCRRHGIDVVLATLAWETISQHLCKRFGCAGAGGGPRVATDSSGRFSGQVAHHADEHHKLRFVRRELLCRRLTFEACVAVGDSRSDLPVFAAAGLAVAYNACPAARAAADVCLESDDLRDVIPVVAGHLGSISPGAA